MPGALVSVPVQPIEYAPEMTLMCAGSLEARDRHGIGDDLFLGVQARLGVKANGSGSVSQVRRVNCTSTGASPVTVTSQIMRCTVA